MGTTTQYPATLSIAHGELEGSPTEDMSKNGLTATRLLHCAWSSRLQLMKELRGYSSRTGDDTAVFLPHPYPYDETISVIGVASEPLDSRVDAQDAALQVAAYQRAKLTVQYGLPEYAGSVAELISESIEPTAEFITFPNAELYWKDDQTERLRDTQVPAVLLKSFDWICTRHGIKDVSLDSSLFTCVGKVNKGTVTSPTLGWTFPAESLLYTPPSLSRVIGSDGEHAWDVSMRFSYRPLGWNKFYKGGEGDVSGSNLIVKPQPIYDGSGKVVKFYEPTSFANLFANIRAAGQELVYFAP